MGIFSKLKPEKILKTLFSGVDKSLLSKEEIVDYSMKAVDNNLEFVKATQKESTPRSITRRVIAIMILSQYFLAFNVGLLGMATGWFDGKEIIILATSSFATLTITVVIFYFGNHVANSILSKFAAKK
jgi:hypothetical protein